MRTAALLVPLVLLASGCSDDNDRMYAFGKAVACFRGAGLKVSESQPRLSPDARGVSVSDSTRNLYDLVFLKSVGLAKERVAELSLPPTPSGLGIPTAKGDRRGNVIVITAHGQGVPSATPRDRRVLDRCLPNE
jgi:hypothetical protein